MCRAYDIHFYPTFRVSAAPPPAARTAGGLGRASPSSGASVCRGHLLLHPVGLQGHTGTVHAPAHTQRGLQARERPVLP